MTMRRRGFLGMLGAAVASPAIPMVAPSAGFSRASYGLAMAHARKYPLVSVRGLVNRLGLSAPEAKAIITSMSSDGVLGGIAPTRPGTIFASSKVYTGNMVKTASTAAKAKQVTATQPKPVVKDIRIPQIKPTKRLAYDVNLSVMMAHLRDLCAARHIGVVA